MDPAALGTLIIGLEAIRHDEEAPTTRRHPTAVVQDNPRRARLARGLRRLADRLDQPSVSPRPRPMQS